VDIYGYYEPQYLGSTLQDGQFQFFSNKLRVDLQSSQAEDVSFGANFNAITYHGQTDWFIPYFLPESITDSMVIFDPLLWSFRNRDSLYLDNAYARIHFNAFDLTIGRQQVSFGTGYLWNPTDLFNYKNLVDPTYEQPGHNAFRLDLSPFAKLNISLLYAPEKDWYRSGKLISVKRNVGHFDLSAIYIEKQWEILEIPGFSNSTRTRRLYGGDFVGELIGLGVWGEWGYNRVKGRDDFQEAVLGLDYSFENGLYVLSEYYHNDLGKADHHEYDLADWLRFFLYQSKSVSRDNIYVYGSYSLTDLIKLNGSAVMSLNDLSVALIPGAYYSYRENLTLELFINLNTGKKSTAWSTELEQSGILRLRFYF
jgi:hypothetical protein